jgi:hypothetical protein
MKRLSTVVVFSDPAISVVYVWNVGDGRGAKVVRKGRFVDDGFEGFKIETSGGPGCVAIIYDGVIKSDGGGKDDGRRGKSVEGRGRIVSSADKTPRVKKGLGVGRTYEARLELGGRVKMNFKNIERSFEGFNDESVLSLRVEIEMEREKRFVGDFKNGKKGAFSKNGSPRRGRGDRGGHVEERLWKVITRDGKAIPVGKTVSDGMVVWGDGEEKESENFVGAVTMTISEREWNLEPRGERGLSQGGARSERDGLVRRRDGGVSMGDICTDACRDERPGVVEKGVKGDVADTDGLY